MQFLGIVSNDWAMSWENVFWFASIRGLREQRQRLAATDSQVCSRALLGESFSRE